MKKVKIKFKRTKKSAWEKGIALFGKKGDLWVVYTKNETILCPPVKWVKRNANG